MTARPDARLKLPRRAAVGATVAGLAATRRRDRPARAEARCGATSTAREKTRNGQQDRAGDVSQASRRPAAGRAGAAGAVPGAWVVHLGADQLRSRGARTRRILDDGRVRALWFRRLDDGPRGLRQIRRHRRQLRHCQRRGGSARGDAGDRAGDRADAVPLHGRVIRRAAGRCVRDGRAGPCGAHGADGADLHRQGLADAGQARRASRVLQDAQPAAARPRDDREHLHARQARHHRSRGGRPRWRTWSWCMATRCRPAPIST